MTIYCHQGQLGEEGKSSVFGEGTLCFRKQDWLGQHRFNPNDSTINLLSDYHIYDTIDSIGMGRSSHIDEKSGSLKGYNRPMVYSVDNRDTLFLTADTLFALKETAGGKDSLDEATKLWVGVLPSSLGKVNRVNLIPCIDGSN